MNRREALRLAALAAFGSSFGPGANAQEGPPDLPTLRAVCDVLLPEDPPAPAASRLGVAEELLETVATKPGWVALLAAGTTWLNDSGPAPFETLAPADQALVIDWMAAQSEGDPARRFYVLVRFFAIEIYYARPEAVAGLPLSPAPQPDGYPPPWT